MALSLNSTIHIGILGCGWLGTAIARKLKEQQIQHTGFVRSIDSVNRLKAEGINAVMYDACDAENFPKNLSIDILIITLPPSVSNSKNRYDEIISGNTAAGKREGIKKFVFTSSTSVYDDEYGVYKEDGKLSNSDRALNLLNAESEIAKSSDGSIIVRLGGLIDENRNPFGYGKDTKLPGNEPINMVYKEDVVLSILHLISKRYNGNYNVVAPIHPNRSDFYKSAFKQNLSELPSMNHVEIPKDRIINSDKLIESGYNFTFPDPIEFPMKNSENIS